MTYRERRRFFRAERKTRLLALLLELEQKGEIVTLLDVAGRAAMPVSTAALLRLELIEEGLIRDRSPEGPQEKTPEDLEARIAAVREAKTARWLRCGKRNLTGAGLKRVLP